MHCSGSSLLAWYSSVLYQDVCPSDKIICYPQVTPVMITLVSDRIPMPAYLPELLSQKNSFCLGRCLGKCRGVAPQKAAEEVELRRLEYYESQDWPFANSSLFTVCQVAVKLGKTDAVSKSWLLRIMLQGSREIWILIPLDYLVVWLLDQMIQLNWKELEAAAWFCSPMEKGPLDL